MTTLPFPQTLALTEKYRPKRICEFSGLYAPKNVLRDFLRAPRSMGWLFLGDSGRGKTTMALALCAALKAELHHVPSRQCDLEAIERIGHICQYVPMLGLGGWHFVLIDEADMMTQAAQMALYSKLDETARPPQTIFVLTANNTVGLEPRFISRLLKLEFDTHGLEQRLPGYLEMIARKERIPRKGLDFERIARECGYNVRNALNQLELEKLGSGYLATAMLEEEKDTHEHLCTKCGKTFKHDEAECELRYRTDCANCGGAERAKATDARKKQIRDASNS